MPDGEPDGARRYVRAATGRYSRRRRAWLWTAQALYFGLPWLSWQGAALLRFDLPGRRFHVLGGLFAPPDLAYLLLPLLALGLALLLAAGLVGRAACGYLCPHAAYGGLFQWIERRIEGGPAARQRLDGGAPSWRKLGLKLFKHGCFVLLSAWIGLTLVAYFTPPAQLLRALPGPWEAACGGAYAALAYVNAGWMRHRFCGALCPWGNMQSALIGQHTLVVRYDAARGEPRGLRNRKSLARGAALGECRDCTLCVQVCPSGSDIRRGLQAACIGCAACIDACDAVMLQLGAARGLVGYARQPGAAPRWRVRLGVAALAALAAALALAWRVPLQLDVARERAPARRLPDGSIDNVYRLHLVNLDARAHRFALAVRGPAGFTLPDAPSVLLGAGAGRVLAVRVRAAPGRAGAPVQAIALAAQAQDAPALAVRAAAVFAAQPD